MVGGETDALFDLASVTKPMFAVAFARSGLDRTARLGAMLEAARGTPAEEAPLELMFAHRAGFPAHLELWKEAHPLAVALGSRSGSMPAPPVYSDVGYLLAGLAAAGSAEGGTARTPDACDDVGPFVDRHLVSELGLSDVLGSARMLEARGVDVMRRAPLTLDRAAPPSADSATEPADRRGRVHDENAFALGGAGACGHAGLFGTIEAVLRFGAHVLSNLEAYDWLIRPREGGTLRAGFDGKSPEGSSAGTVLGPRSFGHLGFTGTSVWIDPDARVVVALLTNRVHPTRENVRIREARPRVHDALARLALGRS